MLILHKSFIFKGIHCSYLPVSRNGRRRFFSKMSERKDVVVGESSRKQKQQPKFPLIRVSNTILAKSVVALFGLGFIDAGYSGDWSRIGVISKDVEELLKIAAFIVVPLCIFLVFSFSKEPADT